jgi:hypothetical protein
MNINIYLFFFNWCRRQVLTNIVTLTVRLISTTASATPKNRRQVDSQTFRVVSDRVERVVKSKKCFLNFYCPKDTNQFIKNVSKTD